MRERAIEILDFIDLAGESLDPAEENTVITANAEYLSRWIN